MPAYIDVPIVVDPDELAQIGFDFMTANIPGWVPAAGNLETWLIEANARIAAAEATVASRFPKAAYRYLGPLHGILPIDATAASATTTWTMRDDSGYTIPAGTLVGIRVAGDELVPFRVVADVIVPSGDTETDAGAVAIVAVTPGAAGSDLGSAAGPAELIDSLDYVTEVELVAATTGGVDAETDDEYLSRLSTLFQLMTPTPILPPDFAAVALNIPGVGRVLALDGYNPADDTYDNERMVALAVTDSEGNEASGGTKTAVQAAVEALRESTFEAPVFDPTYTEVDVSFTVTADAGFDSADVEARTEAAVAAFLSPARWGLPSSGDSRVWIDTAVVRRLDLAGVLKSVQGVAHVTVLQLCEGGGVLGTADVTMDGPASLPTVGDIVGTVA